MSNDTLAQRIDLLREQIESIERSGFYTEKEIDRLSFPLLVELNALHLQLEVNDAEILTPNHIKG